MPARRPHLTAQSAQGQLAEALAELRREAEVPQEFSEAALAEAHETTPEPPELDLRDVPFVTLDPEGAQDLDQALHLERDGNGWLFRYAIADLPGFVRPGGALDTEARTRGQTVYLPDTKIPLHPFPLSEDRASLLPEQDRPAFVWTVRLDSDASVNDIRVERALVRSRAKLTYEDAQARIDRKDATGSLALLPEFGRLRIEQERARGGASLNMPDEEIVRDQAGYRIERRLPLPVEEWNAQLSLLVGIGAGTMMLDSGVGVLRTMPPPDSHALAEFRLRIQALGQEWAKNTSYGDYLRGLDRDAATTPAVMQAAAVLFRGADYESFDGTPPAESQQAAIASTYAHVTAPLRRLVDRWGLVTCEAICAGRPVPEWVTESLPELPSLMQSSGQRASQLGSAALDRVEAALLRDRVGEQLSAIVVEVRESHARVQIEDPPVTAHAPADGLSPGEPVTVRVVRADIATGEIVLATPAQLPGEKAKA